MKAIYMPKGKAGEYAKYACNFYVGCSNNCDYCYCKRGLLSHAMGGTTPTLKKCFEGHSPYGIFIKELHEHIVPLRKHGLFFTFSSDPLLPETQDLNNAAVLYAVNQGVPCKFLTKRADFKVLDSFYNFKHLIAYGFTLTGHDKLEPRASTNAERIEMMRKLHNAGFKTFASIEPIISTQAALQVINDSLDCCDLYNIGLMSGKRDYVPDDIRGFLMILDLMISEYNTKIYLKDSILEFTKNKREDIQLLNLFNNQYVDTNYNIFT